MNPTSPTIEALSLQLHSELAPLDGDKEAQVQVLVTTLRCAFSIDINEVALYRLEPERSVLRFLWPEKLRHVGTIPLSSFDSLAARTAREGVVLIENSFASQRHASAFEKIRLGSGIAASPQPIQKIMSSPIGKEGKILGVIQLSRKGADNGPQIQDFTANVAEILLTLADVFGQYF
jgi:hypothetical protein